MSRAPLCTIASNASDDYLSRDTRGAQKSFDLQGFQFPKHRRKKLTDGRVNVHGPPDQRVRRVRIHDIKEGVHNLVCVQPE